MLLRLAGTLMAIVIAVSLIPLSIAEDRQKQPDGFYATDGVMDISGWDYQRHGAIKLDGQWAFYWNRLLLPAADVQEQDSLPEPDTFIQVPGPWNGHVINGEPLPAHGMGAYRLVLRNVPLDTTFAIKKTNIRFASEVYANGQRLFTDGRVTGSAPDYRAGNTPRIGFFAPSGGDIEIVVQVANFAYANSGIPVSIYFGEQSAMLASHQRSKAVEYGTFAVLAALSLVFAISFTVAALYRKPDITLLLMGLLCLFYALYNGLIGERVLSMFLPDMSFETLFKVKDTCLMASLIALTLYFYHLRQKMISRIFATALIAIFGGHSILVMLLPIPVYAKVEPFVILVYVSLISWLLVRTAIGFVRSAAGERLESFLLFSAVLCITVYCADMVMFSFSMKENMRVGQLYIVLFSMIALFMAVLRFFAAYRTVSTMKNQLLKLDKIKDDFLSNTSHELKTPLNAIVNISDSLLKGVEGPLSDNQSRNLAIVMESGRRLTYLVDDLLDYSKMKHGDILLHRAAIDLHTFVDSVIRIHAFLLGGKPVALDNGIAADFPAIDADGNRLIQILHNLIGNAVKFTESGAVSVGASVSRGMAEVRVSDTGQGIEPDMLERIFLPFEQGDASLVRHTGGTGLGLSITRKLIELHGGTIGVESAPGQGSVFCFTIPLASAAAIAERSAGSRVAMPAEAQAAAASELVDGEYPIVMRGESNETVLVVDDDTANLQTICNLLKLGGYSFAAANRGIQALELLNRLPNVHLAIVDIMMPDMSGYEVLQKIRERFSPSELPVLMLTASNKTRELKLALEGGANDFVSKPFQSEELLARVGSLTRLKASVQTARDAEIAFLRSQINPHFLYNALNAIAELCIDEPGKAEQMTLELSRYLRSCVHFKQLDSLTSLENELELVQAYISIEKARFGARLEIILDVDADTGMRIPPLTLQPLVENAIRHGLMASIRGGRVIVSARRLGDGEVRFSVEDNGVGMDKERLEEVLQPSTGNLGVGLWNIAGRLKLLYGRSFHIESAAGEGTKITFDLPAQQPTWTGG